MVAAGYTQKEFAAEFDNSHLNSLAYADTGVANALVIRDFH